MESLPLASISLGPLDADDDSNLREYFVPFGNFENLLNKDRFIVVGPKGTGKSAIRKYLCELRGQLERFVIDLNEEYGFSLERLSTSSPVEIRNKMRAYFMAVALNYLSNSSNISTSSKSKLKVLESTPLLKEMLKPFKLRVGFVEYALGELFAADKRTNIMTVLDTSVSTTIADALVDNDLWIIIDDIDKVFTNDDDAPSLRFIEGLITAASDVNTKVAGRAIWIVILLKSEIYEELSRTFTELDKEIRYVWEIVWDSDALLFFLGERVRWAFGAKQGKAPWEYLKLLFDVNNKREALTLHEYLVERSINGPRDLLLLVDQAREMAMSQGADKISLTHIQGSEYDYGKIKLREITST